MNKTIILALFYLGACTSLYAKSKVETVSIHSKILGCEKFYNVYLPDDYATSGKNYPVLYLLHGLYGTHETWPKILDMQVIADDAIESGMCHPMIIVMPDAGGENKRHAGRHTGYHNQEGWAYEDFFFQELIPHAEKKYRILGDKSHRAIAGLSMGGHGTMMYATDHPEMFNSACPMSARLTGSIPPDANHDQAYVDDMVNNDFVKNFPSYSQEKLEAMKTVRWLFDCGDDDKLLDGTLQLYMMMREQGFNAELRVRNGGHHHHYWRTSLPITMTFVSMGFTEKYMK